MLNTTGLPPAFAAVFAQAASDQLTLAAEAERDAAEDRRREYLHDQSMNEGDADEDGDPEDRGYCTTCSGSGEGMYDGSRCSSCGGTGSA